MANKDILITLKGAKSVGLFLYNINVTSCRIGGNYIHGRNVEANMGIQFRSSSATSLITIRDNYLSGCKVGINRLEGDKASVKAYKMVENVFTNCKWGVSGF